MATDFENQPTLDYEQEAEAQAAELLNTTEAHERRQSQEALRVAQEAKVNEALEQHELAKAARRSASPPPEGHAGAGADLPEGMASGTHVMEISSTTHRKEWATLSRVAKGPRASEFPEVARLFQGTKAQKLEVLKAFVERGSLEAIEASFQATRQHDDSLQVKRKLMTLDEMNAAGFSEHLACMAKLVCVWACHFSILNNIRCIFSKGEEAGMHPQRSSSRP